MPTSLSTQKTRKNAAYFETLGEVRYYTVFALICVTFFLCSSARLHVHSKRVEKCTVLSRIDEVGMYAAR